MSYPSNRPTTNSVGFSSRTVGTRITIENHLDVVADDDVADVVQEVGAALAQINTRIRLAGAERARTGRAMPHPQWAALNTDRTTLATLHQALLNRKREINRRERAERDEQEAARLAARRDADAPTFDQSFRLIARRELDAPTFQRITIQAEIRHASEMQRHHATKAKPTTTATKGAHQ